MMFSLEHSRAPPRRDANEAESSPEHGTTRKKCFIELSKTSTDARHLLVRADRRRMCVVKAVKSSIRDFFGFLLLLAGWLIEDVFKWKTSVPLRPCTLRYSPRSLLFLLPSPVCCFFGFRWWCLNRLGMRRSTISFRLIKKREEIVVVNWSRRSNAFL